MTRGRENGLPHALRRSPCRLSRCFCFAEVSTGQPHRNDEGEKTAVLKLFCFFIIPHSELRIPHYFALIVIMQKQKRVRLKAERVLFVFLVHTLSARQHMLCAVTNVSTKIKYYTNSIIAISAASPRRGPVLTIRV